MSSVTITFSFEKNGTTVTTQKAITIDTFSPVKNHSGLILDDGTNPHGTTKTDVGLSNVDNTSDADKPISTATQTALDNKVDISTNIDLINTSRFEARCLGQAVNGRIENYNTAVQNIGLKDSNASLLFDAKVCGVGTSKLFNLKPFDIYKDFTVVRNSTATRINSLGLIETVGVNVPRIDYTDGEAVLLTEPQSTNLYLNNAVMVTQNVTTLASTYTVSFYGTGTITFSGSYVGSLVGTGINDRVSLTFVTTAGSLTSTVTGTVTYGQIENLSYATSVIITLGTTVTRLGDVITGAGDVNTFNSEEGVIYINLLTFNDNSFRRVSLTDITGNNAVYFYFNPNSNSITWVIYSNSIRTFILGAEVSDVTYYNKIAIRWKQSNFSFWANGSKITEYLLGDAPLINTIDRLNLSSNGVSNPFYGKIKEIRVLPYLTDAELITLTT